MDGTVLAEVFAAWAARVRALTEAEWSTPTRLPGWTVQDLVAHMAPDKRVLELLRGPRVDSPAITSGAQMLRIYNMPGGVAHTAADQNAELAREAASAGPEALVAFFIDDGPEVIAEFRNADPNIGVAHPHPALGTVSFGTLIEVMIVEATVHMLDLMAAVGGDPIPAAALRRTAEILSAVPDPVEFIEAASGRSTATVLPVMR
ncbi:maleylpyruvate isomerase N-terminal domain-containing protein [Nocardia sp. CDC159]|uniref:Maleylpyruvate isomerase N-terminal domain-containing protein n=1 Tax=Nocardia pulmonis TaxID=2951408 RepID=A0A9X2E977_9NOCA|nr:MULTISPECIES: maleylpyruvate isomerase N-terminal domain-containing protein [Nocardia]MCM6776016.1 maleylpyruvate isomerase N-terminal domain-containing protein [Nocardia pulmonis]MCM6788657.1 maleylpyruvate isomerase N-terminal domain-containing protein [Nocardia sp. CDC159]